MGERRRIEGGEVYGTDIEAQGECSAEKNDLSALQGSQLRLLGRGLNDAVGARRIVMVGVPLGRVGVQRRGGGGGSRSGCGLRLNRRGIAAVGVVGMSMVVAIDGFPVVMMGMGRVVVGGVVMSRMVGFG